jgi:hypothetical protein
MADIELVPKGTPKEVADRVREIAAKPAKARVPNFDPRLGVAGAAGGEGEPPNRLVLIGDSLTHGFQSGAIFNTDLSYGAIIAHELGWLDRYRFPRYPGYGGLPLNVEFLLRDLEERYGAAVNGLEMPLALFRARHLMDEIEDYWERGAGTHAPTIAGINHCLAVYGWDLRDALDKTARSCEETIGEPNDDLLKQVIENNGERAALRVYPHLDEAAKDLTVFGAAAKLGEEGGDGDGIETLIVFLGANNALGSVTSLKVHWSGDGYDNLRTKAEYNVWRPAHFASELALVEARVREIRARHVIWCTVPHVTIAPIARGIGSKLTPGSRYYPFYTRPWIDEAGFRPHEDPCITGAEARAVDTAIDMYNDAIEATVKGARDEGRDWYMLDIAGLLDRLAARRYINDANARPPWWTPFPLPAALKALDPVPDSRFLTSDGNGGRATGGLFSLDGVHPTTIAYGLIAQEMINVMRLAGVRFLHGQGALRTDPVTVDFDRLIARDTLLRRPPQNLRPALEILGWADEAVDWTKRALARA